MNISKLIPKLTNKLLDQSFKLIGIDRLSMAKIYSRNDLRSFGSKYGSWVIPEALISSESICYCVGCGEDISFDIELIDKIGCDVFAFDPTPRAIEFVQKVAGNNPKYHFYNLGLWDKKDILKFYSPKKIEHVSYSLLNLQKTENYISVEVDNLKNIMDMIGHGKIDLLKIDIEGAEYKVIQSILNEKLNVKVICVEYDECFNPLDKDFKKRIRDSIESLVENGYSLACVQGSGNYTFIKSL